jgi:DNA-binding transcriptional MerR regulator
MERYYRPHEAAAKLGITTGYLAQLVREGKISASGKTKGKHRRYTDEDLARASSYLSGNVASILQQTEPHPDPKRDQADRAAARLPELAEKRQLLQKTQKLARRALEQATATERARSREQLRAEYDARSEERERVFTALDEQSARIARSSKKTSEVIAAVRRRPRLNSLFSARPDANKPSQGMVGEDGYIVVLMILTITVLTVIAIIGINRSSDTGPSARVTSLVAYKEARVCQTIGDGIYGDYASLHACLSTLREKENSQDGTQTVKSFGNYSQIEDCQIQRGVNIADREVGVCTFQEANGRELIGVDSKESKYVLIVVRDGNEQVLIYDTPGGYYRGTSTLEDGHWSETKPL